MRIGRLLFFTSIVGVLIYAALLTFDEVTTFRIVAMVLHSTVVLVGFWHRTALKYRYKPEPPQPQTFNFDDGSDRSLMWKEPDYHAGVRTQGFGDLIRRYDRTLQLLREDARDQTVEGRRHGAHRLP